MLGFGYLQRMLENTFVNTHCKRKVLKSPTAITYTKKLAGHRLSEIQSIPNVPPKETTGRIIDMSKFAPFLVAAGILSDLLAIFIPWGEMGSVHWYLPLSVPIGWPAVFMETSSQIIAIAILIKAALVMTLLSLLLYQRSKDVLFQLSLLISVGFAMAAFAVAFMHGMILYLGFYAVLVAMVLKVIAFSFKYVEVELVA